ncbi:zinc metalloproteinase nas-15-like [Scylla paramamosain]|uniref:zinc metalloproteinase nas-15-like n=1 Tax=Scylla paramamosain TaxID=85552 RepID=UPI0030832D98
MMPGPLLLLTLVALCSAAPKDPHIIALDEKSTYLEADILPDKAQVQNKMAVRDNHRLWPGGRLLYQLDFDTESNRYVKDLILSAVDEINAERCVTLTTASSSDVDHVSIRLGGDYSSHMGRQGGAQNLTVVAETIHRGSVMHELMHALGFGHEHNRPDRDDYVVIDFSNIHDTAKPYFKKYTSQDPVKDEQLAYDYMSLMHATDMYDDRVNIDTSKPVIWRKDGGQDLGQRSMLTPLDKQRLRKIYSCEVCKNEAASEHPLSSVLYNRLFRYPGDCSKYISCSNTSPYVMNCPAGLHFSLDLNRCEYPITANCTSLTNV